MDRSQNFQLAKDRRSPWDIVVIGGGATGVGCALDAATRGLDVLLLEGDDLGKHTSSRSTKLVHGGVRYLAQGDLALVREALHERGTLLNNAPHVVHKYEFVVPCKNIFEKFFYAAGLKIYDALAGRSSFGRSQMLSAQETVERIPGVDPAMVKGGVSYWDGQFDDSRLLIDIAVTASKRGACLINYARVEGLAHDQDGRWNIAIRDVISDETLNVSAHSVINATGVFADRVRKMSDTGSKDVVRFARGSHLILPLDLLPSEAALMIPKTPDGRVLFCIPWHERLLVGTTDVQCETPDIGEAISDDEIDFLLETASKYLIKKPTRKDIISSFAGVRPLIRRSDSTKTSALSRSHELFIDGNGLVTITGGKWTTYRQMAEESVDAAVKIAGLDAGKCVTKDLAIDPPAEKDPIERAIDDEMACTVEDILYRRTRIALLDPQLAAELSPAIESRLRAN